MPAITGTPTVGSVLTADPGRWRPATARLHLRWYAGGEALAGATGTSYTVRTGDVGSLVTVRVTASDHGRHTTTSSAATTPATTPAT
ncbi:MAG TPA: hypothetical protein VHW64_15350 [Nocardioides sp.]|uniref:hypothetical protein n=1 Tax=Nocardioides sp. TaxID=35761 RepID=UPI002E367648|nr:hypothetical protein [Nocardioides sp.]HEX3932079.1 hypothetical protein [Nocardioides sp.]